MHFALPLIEARFIRRYQRFFADFTLFGGDLVTAHCANTGSMKSCLVSGARAWLSRSDNPKRKLAYTWQIASSGHARIYVNPVGANAVVAEAVAAGSIGELPGYTAIRREVPCGRRSRIDLLLERPGERCLVEVKNATLDLGHGRAAFPDAITERGRRHIDVLQRARRRGARAVMLFCVSRSDARTFEPADDIDPAYGRALRRAARGGVEVLAYKCSITQRGVWLRHPLPVRL